MPKSKSTFKEGEKVSIVAGSYASNRTGTFVGPRGMRVAIQVDGDIKKERVLWWSSISALRDEDKQRPTNGDAVIQIPKSEYNALLKEVNDLSTRLSRLQIKLQQYEI